MSDSRPIGIFDSGVGGLTVANAIRQVLPNEKLIYFGDTAHLPYGDKSKETIIHYSKEIAGFLLKQDCKLIVIACNSASANAFEDIIELAGSDIPVMNVIDPVVDHITEQTVRYKQVGVIGTKSTIASETYPQKIKSKDSAMLVSSMATPLFVPMIEEGFIFDDISNAIIRNYLSRHEIGGLDALILGCTHYPIIKNQVSKFYNFGVEVIDSSKIVAKALVELLERKKIDNTERSNQENLFFVSDLTPSFKIIAKMFFEEEINLQLHNLWS